MNLIGDLYVCPGITQVPDTDLIRNVLQRELHNPRILISGGCDLDRKCCCWSTVAGSCMWKLFVTLNASARNSSFWASRICMVLETDISNCQVPGPRMLYEPILPSVPVAGSAECCGIQIVADGFVAIRIGQDLVTLVRGSAQRPILTGGNGEIPAGHDFDERRKTPAPDPTKRKAYLRTEDDRRQIEDLPSIGGRQAANCPDQTAASDGIRQLYWASRQRSYCLPAPVRR